MNNATRNNGKNGIRVWIPVLVAIIGTFGAGAGANYLLVSKTDFIQEIARPDPFTGTEAAALKAEHRDFRSSDIQMRLDIAALKKDVEILRRDLDRLETGKN